MSTEQSPSRGGHRPPVALIAGPTASGKSELAVRLALALADGNRRGVVLNADSAQVYRDLRILSARPGFEDMRGVEHRLFGAWDGANPCSAADWAAATRREVAALHGEGAVPILCGGTGLYLRTLLDGIAPVPHIDPAIRSEVRGLSQPEARKALEAEDPECAARLAPADTTRTTRALEVVRSTGRPLADWQARKTGGIAADIALYPVILLPDRAWLNERCDRRFAEMFEDGALEEVRALLARHLDPRLPVMRAIGVREIAAFLEGVTTREEAIAAGQLSTRQYAKRQYTWFRNQPPPDWPRIASAPACIAELFPQLLYGAQ